MGPAGDLLGPAGTLLGLEKDREEEGHGGGEGREGGGGVGAGASNLVWSNLVWSNLVQSGLVSSAMSSDRTRVSQGGRKPEVESREGTTAKFRNSIDQNQAQLVTKLEGNGKCRQDATTSRLGFTSTKV